MAKEKIKKVVAEIDIEETYYANYECPYCYYCDNREVEMDNVTLTETCRDCGKKYKIKIPKDSI